MGIDIRLEKNDLKFSNNQDLSLIRGYDNLKQAIINRLKTIKGEFYNTYYGSELDKCFSLPISNTLRNQFIGYIIEALNQEPRIKSREEINIEFIKDNNQFYALINIKVVPIDSMHAMNIVFPFFFDYME